MLQAILALILVFIVGALKSTLRPAQTEKSNYKFRHLVIGIGLLIYTYVSTYLVVGLFI